ncbi:MAG: HesB/IscA family protein [Myxococcales bacterium]|nr:iron-sulfur cluster assembly accessory protein [Myxococcales bacterium]
MTLTLTRRAIEAVQARAAQAEVPGWLLRVAVVAGGCNGLTYDLYFVESAGPEDTVIEAGEVLVVIDRASAPLLDGTVIDLPKRESFRFENPKARKTCSCGASFEI